MTYFDYLDAQVKYVLPRIEHASNKVFFMQGINIAKETYLNRPWLMSNITGIKFDYPVSKGWMSSPERYFDMALEVSQELYISMKNKGFFTQGYSNGN